MDKLFIKATSKTPAVRLDSEEGLIEIKGRSIPENTEKTYSPIIQWIDEYLSNPRKKTTINFYFEYINSSSTKVLVYLMNKLLVANKSSVTEILVNWIYSDDDMLEFGKDFEELTSIKFKFILKKSE